LSPKYHKNRGEDRGEGEKQRRDNSCEQRGSGGSPSPSSAPGTPTLREWPSGSRRRLAKPPHPSPASGRGGGSCRAPPAFHLQFQGGGGAGSDAAGSAWDRVPSLPCIRLSLSPGRRLPSRETVGRQQRRAGTARRVSTDEDQTFSSE